MLAALQDRLRDVVSPSPPPLRCMARAHPVATIVKELAGQEGVRMQARPGSALGVLLKQRLHTIPRHLIDDRIMKAVVKLTFVGQAAKVDRLDRILQRWPRLMRPPPVALPVPSVRNGSRAFSWSRAAFSRTTLPNSL